MSLVNCKIVFLIVTLDLLGSLNCFDHGYDFVSSPEDMRFIDEDIQTLDKIRVARQVFQRPNGGRTVNTGGQMNPTSQGFNRRVQQRQQFNTNGGNRGTMGTNGGQMGMTGGNIVNSRGTMGNTGTMGNKQQGTMKGVNFGQGTGQQQPGTNQMVNRQTGNGFQHNGQNWNGQPGGMIKNNKNMMNPITGNPTRASGQNGIQTGNRQPANSNTQIYKFQPNRKMG